MEGIRAQAVDVSVQVDSGAQSPARTPDGSLPTTGLDAPLMLVVSLLLILAAIAQRVRHRLGVEVE